MAFRDFGRRNNRADPDHGFSVHNSVVVEPEDPAAVERLIRYMMRPPVALDRLEYDEAAGMIEIRSRPGSDEEPDGEPQERADADELVARVIAQVPESEASPDPCTSDQASREPWATSGAGRAGRPSVADARVRRSTPASHR